MDGTENKTPNQNIKPKFFDDLPEEARNSLTGPWEVNAGFNGPKQVQRTMIKVEDYLDGNTPEGSDKKALKAEAGRILAHIRQSFDNEDFLKDVPQRNYYKSEADRLWDEEGGKEAYESWMSRLGKPEATATPETEASASEAFLGRLLEAAQNTKFIKEIALRSLDDVIENLKTNYPLASMDGLELSRKIIDRFDTNNAITQVDKRVTQAREAIATIDASSYLKDEEEKTALGRARAELAQALVVGILRPLGGLHRLARNSPETQVTSVINSVCVDIEDALRTSMVEKIEATEGSKINLDSMEPVGEEISSDQKHASRDIIARVEENGYRFGDAMRLYGGSTNDVIQTPKVEVFKYEK